MVEKTGEQREYYEKSKRMMKGIQGGVGAESWNSQQVKLLTPPPHPSLLSLSLSLSGSVTVCHLSRQ